MLDSRSRVTRVEWDYRNNVLGWHARLGDEGNVILPNPLKLRHGIQECARRTGRMVNEKRIEVNDRQP